MQLYDGDHPLAAFDEQVLKNIQNPPNDYEKFSRVQPSRILEENLIFTIDGNEILFQVAQEVQQQLQTRFISIDLYQKSFKIWSPNFEQCVLSK